MMNKKKYGEKIIKMNEVQKLTSLSRSTIWRLEKSGHFPSKIQLAEKAIGWIEGDIQRWIQSRRSNKKRSQK